MPSPRQSSERIDRETCPEARRASPAAWLALAASLLTAAGAAVFVARELWPAAADPERVTELIAPPPLARPQAPRAANVVRPGPVVRVPSTRSEASLPPRAAAPKPARDGAAHRASDATLTALTPPPPTQTKPSATFEALAEASEKAVPMGLEATLFDAGAALQFGEEPPPAYPRTRCNDIFVYIVTLAEGDPMQSAASLGIGKAGPARLRRPGERLGDFSVLAISDDWTGLNPRVWLEREGAVCHADLAGNPARLHQPLKPKPPAKVRRRRGRRR